jgi:hypothetical protein
MNVLIAVMMLGWAQMPPERIALCEAIQAEIDRADERYHAFKIDLRTFNRIYDRALDRLEANGCGIGELHDEVAQELFDLPPPNRPH